jgi:hypothetical protein
VGINEIIRTKKVPDYLGPFYTQMPDSSVNVENADRGKLMTLNDAETDSRVMLDLLLKILRKGFIVFPARDSFRFLPQLARVA